MDNIVFLCPCRFASDFPVFGSHSLTRLSFEPDAKSDFEGCQSMHFTSHPWPDRTRSSDASAKFHILILPSSEHEANLLSEGEKLYCFWKWIWNGGEKVVQFELDWIVSNQFERITIELRQVSYDIFMPLESFQIVHWRLPVFDDPLIIRRYHPSVIMRPSHCSNCLVMCLEYRLKVKCESIPECEFTRGSTCDESSSVWCPLWRMIKSND